MHIIKASLLNIVGRMFSILSTFVSIYLLGRVFNNQDFGYWTWLLSIFSLVTAQDFGIIGVMRVRMGQAIVSGEILEQKLLFTVTFFITALTGICLIAASAILLSVSVLNPNDILLVLGCALITVLGYCASQGSVAYLQSGLVGISESFRGIVQILAVVSAKVFDLNFDTSLIMFYLVSMLYMPFVTAVFLMCRKWRPLDLITTLINNLPTSLKIAKGLSRDGFFLLTVQVCLAVLTLSDVFIAGFLLPDDEVAAVNALMRLILVAVGFVMAIMTPVMGHFVVAIHSLNQEIVWKRFSIASFILILIGSAYGIILYFFGSNVIKLWANLYVAPSYVFIVAGLFFSSMGMVILLQTFLQMPLIAIAMLPILITAAILKTFLPFVIVPSIGFGGVILSGTLVNFVFVLAVVVLLFHLNYFKRALPSASP